MPLRLDCIRDNADVIAFVKAGFIGAWGEWHSSKNQNTCYGSSGATPCSVAYPNQLIVRDALMSAFDSGVPIQFRYPLQLTTWFPSALDASGAFSGSMQSRTGAHSDCFLGGATDTGTYASDATGTAQRNYIAAVSDYTPYGGETAVDCDDPHRTACRDILEEGTRFHLAWFKGPSSSISEWTDAWSSGGCMTTVTNLMGYRLQLDRVTHQGAAAAGESITVSVSLRNVGWARLFSARKLRVVLVHGSTVLTADADAFLRELPPQATSSTTQAIHIAIPAGAALGDYTVSLQIPDVFPATRGLAAFAVRFANADDSNASQRWDAPAFRFVTGTRVTVR